MRIRDMILLLVDGVVWYGFVYYWLFSIKNPVALPAASLLLVILAAIGIGACPLVHKTQAWQQLIHGRDTKKK